MARIPKNDAAFLTFARQRITQWVGGQGGPPDIGLAPQQLADTDAAVSTAETAYNNMLANRSAARDSTLVKNTAFDALRAIFGADVATIDAYARATDDPNVYALAGLPAPKTPSERAAPPPPTDLKADIRMDGSVLLSFKGATGGGAQYHVHRRIIDLDGQVGPFQFVGYAKDDKTFLDNAVPDGVRSVGYRVAARLSTGLMSDWSLTYAIPFGTQDNGPVGTIGPADAGEHKSAG